MEMADGWREWDADVGAGQRKKKRARRLVLHKTSGAPSVVVNFKNSINYYLWQFFSFFPVVWRHAFPVVWRYSFSVVWRHALPPLATSERGVAAAGATAGG